MRIFRHFKGDEYDIICKATHSETNELLVIYRSLKSGAIYARPHDMFFGKTEDGQERFVEITLLKGEQTHEKTMSSM